MAFKLKIIPFFEEEIKDLLKKVLLILKEKPIDIEFLPKIRLYPALIMKK